MSRLLSLFILLLVATSAIAQNPDMPNDFLGKDWHKQRRQKLRESLPANSVAVFFANAVRNRANDVDYAYHQDPNFFYLTGYREPEAVLFVFKDKQTAANGTQYDEIIFVQERNALRELWTGRRLGVEGTKTQLGLEQAFNGSEFKKYNVDFSKFAEILFVDFKNDVRDNARDSAHYYVLLFGGGIIPQRDVDALTKLGVGRLFTPGADTREIVSYLDTYFAGKRAR